MKRSVQKDAIVSDYTRAEFLNFSFYLIIFKKPNLKIWLFENAKTFSLATNCPIVF